MFVFVLFTDCDGKGSIKLGAHQILIECFGMVSMGPDIYVPLSVFYAHLLMLLSTQFPKCLIFYYAFLCVV
jgi:hypothetical protein